MSDALRVAVVVPPWYDVPPDAYGGIERMTADLVDELVVRGHQVWLIGTGEDRTLATFVPAGRRPDLASIGRSIPTIRCAAEAEQALRSLDVDVVHDHSEAGPLLAGCRSAPTVVTAHGPVTGPFRDYYRALGSSIRLVGLSQAQLSEAPELNWAGVVPNGVRVDGLRCPGPKEDYVAFLGRMSPDKGAHLAVAAARAAGRPIRLAGRCVEPEERRYFEEVIRPLLGPDVEWLGEAGTAMKRELLSRARCLLFPICWEEPFGMVMIEANACGTPVVALRRGSVAEVIQDGVNGYVCDHPDQLPDAVRAAELLDPARCRDQLRGRFDPPTMARGYEEIYLRAIRDMRHLVRDCVTESTPSVSDFGERWAETSVNP